jgi:hypothetical protein
MYQTTEGWAGIRGLAFMPEQARTIVRGRIQDRVGMESRFHLRALPLNNGFNELLNGSKAI